MPGIPLWLYADPSFRLPGKPLTGALPGADPHGACSPGTRSAAEPEPTAPFDGYPCPKCRTGRLHVAAVSAPLRRNQGVTNMTAPYYATALNRRPGQAARSRPSRSPTSGKWSTLHPQHPAEPAPRMPAWCRPAGETRPDTDRRPRRTDTIPSSERELGPRRASCQERVRSRFKSRQYLMGFRSCAQSD